MARFTLIFYAILIPNSRYVPSLSIVIMMTMDDLAKIQMFLSEYINPEAEVTWEYGVDDSLKNNQMRLTLVLG